MSSREAVAYLCTPLAVTISTPPGRDSSSGRPAATSRPRSMIATRSQTCSTSLSRCVLSSTATPRRRSSSSSPRTVRRPAGSSALVGSSSSSSAGLPTSAWAIPRRCCMPFDIVSIRRSRPPAALSPPLRHRLAPPLARLGEPDELEQLGALGRAAVGAREPLVQREQLVGARPAGGAEQLGEVAGGAPRRRRAGGRAAHLRGPAARADQAARDLDQRR